MWCPAARKQMHMRYWVWSRRQHQARSRSNTGGCPCSSTLTSVLTPEPMTPFRLSAKCPRTCRCALQPTCICIEEVYRKSLPMQGHIGSLGGFTLICTHIKCIGAISCNAPGWLHCLCGSVYLNPSLLAEQHIDMAAEPADVCKCVMHCDSIL